MGSSEVCVRRGMGVGGGVGERVKHGGVQRYMLGGG